MSGFTYHPKTPFIIATDSCHGSLFWRTSSIIPSKNQMSTHFILIFLYNMPKLQNNFKVLQSCNLWICPKFCQLLTIRLCKVTICNSPVFEAISGVFQLKSAFSALIAKKVYRILFFLLYKSALLWYNTFDNKKATALYRLPHLMTFKSVRDTEKVVITHGRCMRLRFIMIPSPPT